VVSAQRKANVCRRFGGAVDTVSGSVVQWWSGQPTPYLTSLSGRVVRRAWSAGLSSRVVESAPASRGGAATNQGPKGPCQQRTAFLQKACLPAGELNEQTWPFAALQSHASWEEEYEYLKVQRLVTVFVVTRELRSRMVRYC